MQQSPRDVVCTFARPIVPAPGVESMEKEQGIRIVLVAIQGARPESHQSAPAVSANLIAKVADAKCTNRSRCSTAECDSPPAPGCLGRWATLVKPTLCQTDFGQPCSRASLTRKPTLARVSSSRRYGRLWPKPTLAPADHVRSKFDFGPNGVCNPVELRNALK